jgi:phosphoribosylaminoimidazolecarboxamide formyltransferase/IMP cyclohydrolase
MSISIKRALVSVSNKQGIVEFARELSQLGVEIISTGGTYKHLRDNGISVNEVSSVTNFPEILDGRVKTLHPKVHGGILANRSDDKHNRQLQEHQIECIDLVCVNLYPFEETINQPNCQLKDAIENIDIGGPTMIRAAAKNCQHVVVVTNPDKYTQVLYELKQTKQVSDKTRLSLAREAFEHTAYYDSIISQYLKLQQESVPTFSDTLTIAAKLVQKLRYGENSHQSAAFYRDSGSIKGLLASFEMLQGKELSYNNLADSDTAWECVKQFSAPTCVIVKHANPCGVAIASDVLSSYKRALAGDPVSSFGGIIAFNQVVDEQTALEIAKQFIEVIIAPGFTSVALQVFAKKPNIRVLQIALSNSANCLDYKRVGGGILVQTPENKHLYANDLKQVSKKSPTSLEIDDLLFAWNVVRFIKSNAIVLVKDKQVIGIGAGQMSRIDSTNIAVTKASKFGFDVAGSVCASDAFFPFRDNVDLLAQHKVSAIIHPGGSIKDTEVFTASDEANMAMLTTSVRCFRH